MIGKKLLFKPNNLKDENEMKNVTEVQCQKLIKDFNEFTAQKASMQEAEQVRRQQEASLAKDYNDQVQGTGGYDYSLNLTDAEKANENAHRKNWHQAGNKGRKFGMKVLSERAKEELDSKSGRRNRDNLKHDVNEGMREYDDEKGNRDDVDPHADNNDRASPTTQFATLYGRRR